MKKVIIIGAGIAGLAACNEFLRQGFQPEILEARERAGGRIWTNNALGTPLSLGAGWIHGVNHNPITRLANHFHAKICPVKLDRALTFDRNYQLISNKQIHPFEKKFAAMLTQAKQFAFQQSHDISLATALEPFIQKANLSSIEQDLLQKKRRFFEGYHGANYELLSARYWDSEEAWPGEQAYVSSSYEAIINGLAKPCKIHFNTIVKAICLHKTHVEIITENNQFIADKVVITVPLGVLKKQAIEFMPALPFAKQNAIERLGMGLFNIIALKFPAPFWPKEAPFLSLMFKDPLSVTTFFNHYLYTHEPILLGYSGGQTSHALEKLSDEQLIKKVMHNLSDFFGKNLPPLEKYCITRWSQDPFSYGSYSYLPVNSTPSDRQALAEPIANRLFFAGEAASLKYPATVHGAYLSGLATAKQVLN